MSSSKRIVLGAGVAVLFAALAGGGWWWQHRGAGRVGPATAAPLDAKAAAQAAGLQADLRELLLRQRQIVVLMNGRDALAPAQAKQVLAVGQALFHDKLDVEARVAARAQTLLDPKQGGAGLAPLQDSLDYMESAPDLFDADRLAFREALVSLRAALAGDASLPAIKLHKRIGEDLDALDEIERNYDKEISRSFAGLDQRGIVLKREKWDDYLAKLNRLISREQVLKAFGVIVPYDPKDLPQDDTPAEIFGNGLPPKTIALTFDDGPHPVYTDEIVAILKQYGVPGTFFEVGRNLGTLDAQQHAHLLPAAAVSKRLVDEGYAVGNHSFSHAQLNKETGAALEAEVLQTDALLRAVDARRAPIFRFPYGARNAEGLKVLDEAKLRSVMWNVDSLDWADPVPSSVAARVLAEVTKQGRGIVLFHDIHPQAIKALPIVLDRLVADGYRFAAWDGQGFSVKADATAAAAPVTSGYAESWAVVIGIDDYAKWPKLKHAVHDAESVRDALVNRLGFDASHVVLLKNADATRNGILSTFHERFGDGKLQRNDRLFVYYAGHGATRQLPSGREVGYIVPVDADPQDTATDAISMSEVQNVAESLEAKHVFFVMDACFSGLGLTRGGAGNYLRDNARRTARQMLTAGGADQEVADDGPDGHSVFTWTLLQGLAGKADLNGDGLITATELAAYVAPAVASVSLQTPSFGSLPGSQGGDFVFELPAQQEFISGDTTQLGGAAIALNAKIAAAEPAVQPGAPGRPAQVAPVVVKDLAGQDQTIKAPVLAAPSLRQAAQQANDRGLLAYKEKRYADAEAGFTEALKLRPDFAQAANNLGFVYFKQEKYAEAARWFHNAITLDPSRAIAYLNLGDALAKGGDAAHAKDAYKTYLELAPKGSGADYARQQLGDGA
ncbi:MAG: polysaccharide deacetylase family protein [Pelomonas sp.]|nr:polysaccharide deacetylase family protein [Roseateles sp.]